MPRHLTASLILIAIFCCLIASAFAGTFVPQYVVPGFLSKVTNAYMETGFGQFMQSISAKPDRTRGEPVFATLFIYAAALAAIPFAPVLRLLYLPFLIGTAGIVVAAISSMFQSLFLFYLLIVVLACNVLFLVIETGRKKANSAMLCLGVYTSAFLTFDLVALIVWDFGVVQWLLLLSYQAWAIPTCAWVSSIGDDDEDLLAPGIHCGGLHWYTLSVYAPIIAWVIVPFVRKDADI